MRLGGCGAAFCIAKQNGQSCRATIAGRRGGGAPISLGRYGSRSRSFEIDWCASRALDFDCAIWQSSSSSTAARTAARLPIGTIANRPWLNKLASWAAFQGGHFAIVHALNRPRRQIRPRRRLWHADSEGGQHGEQTEGQHGCVPNLEGWRFFLQER
jgi:hypothetical protein